MRPPPRLACAVLAAGSGRRFGADKILAPVAGRAMLAWTLRGVAEVAARITLGVLVVVDPNRRREIEAAVLDAAGPAAPPRIVESPDPHEGMAASLRAAAAHARRMGADGLLICLADMPGVDRRVLDPLLDAWRPGGIAVAVGGQGPTPPVVFAARDLSALGALTGDQGARAVWVSAGARTRRVPVPGGWWRDVDRPEDLKEMERLLRAGGDGAS